MCGRYFLVAHRLPEYGVSDVGLGEFHSIDFHKIEFIEFLQKIVNGQINQEAVDGRPRSNEPPPRCGS